MTGYASLDTAVEAMRLGAVDYVRKPLFDDALIAIVDRALGRPCPATPVAGADEAVAAPAEEPLIAADGLALWTTAMWRVVHAPHDVATVGRWAVMLCISEDTLYTWCRTQELRAKASLDLARVLRAVRCARQRGGKPAQFLAVSDRHTLRRLLVQGGWARVPRRRPIRCWRGRHSYKTPWRWRRCARAFAGSIRIPNRAGHCTLPTGPTAKLPDPPRQSSTESCREPFQKILQKIFKRIPGALLTPAC